MPFHQVRRDPAFRETELSAGLQAPRRPGLSCKTTPTGLNVSLERRSEGRTALVAVQSVARIDA
ncbi:hypothetical protein BT69DRAFT_267653 [Atractiella rhizophila]|nr:hypothetical protein BT69DRAFT_267653 [Atractiella rhizophila]